MLLFLQGACAENWTDIFSGASDPEITLPQNVLVKKWFQPFPQFLLAVLKEALNKTNDLKKEILRDRSFAAFWLILLH